MRYLLLALLVVALGAPFVAVPTASAQVVAPCAIGQAAPFAMPQAGVDPFGRPFAIQVMAVYGPYDGFGYPLMVNSVGTYAGRPYARAYVSYVPMPCPVVPTPYPFPGYSGW
jgi:hypothetical protein